MTRQEIIDLALRYVPSEEISDFPFTGDLFCLLLRDLPTGKVLSEEEGWVFNGYGVCTGYSYDHEAKPVGKWLWMHFASLAAFPPSSQVLRLQPPHVIKGRFQNSERSHEIRILKISFTAPEKTTASGRSGDGNDNKTPPQRINTTAAAEDVNKILSFRKKGAS